MSQEHREEILNSLTLGLLISRSTWYHVAPSVWNPPLQPVVISLHSLRLIVRRDTWHCHKIVAFPPMRWSSFCSNCYTISALQLAGAFHQVWISPCPVYILLAQIKTENTPGDQHMLVHTALLMKYQELSHPRPHCPSPQVHRWVHLLSDCGKSLGTKLVSVK